MAGYLDEYGVTDARRERLRKRILIWGVLAVVVGTAVFFSFRNWGEERTMDRFMALLKRQNYAEAYRMWQTPGSAKFYPPEKFAEDWGPAGVYKYHRHADPGRRLLRHRRGVRCRLSGRRGFRVMGRAQD